MTSRINAATVAQPGVPKKTLQKLRKEAGYKSATDFAAELNIPYPTYSRYEQKPSSMPLRAAWLIADKLNTSIDAIVDRTDPEAVDELRQSYDRLSPMSKVLLDDYLGYLESRERSK